MRVSCKTSSTATHEDFKLGEEKYNSELVEIKDHIQEGMQFKDEDTGELWYVVHVERNEIDFVHKYNKRKSRSLIVVWCVDVNDPQNDDVMLDELSRDDGFRREYCTPFNPDDFDTKSLTLVTKKLPFSPQLLHKLQTLLSVSY